MAHGNFYKITFDSNRANKIQSVTNKDYEFEADLGDLQPLTQVTHIRDAVRADFMLNAPKIALTQS